MSDIDNLEKRVDKIEAKLENVTTQITKTDAQYGYIVQAIGELKGQVNSILAVPNKRWELVISVIITAILTGVITTFVGK